MISEKATFAAGCFWGVEVDFRNTPGVHRRPGRLHRRRHRRTRPTRTCARTRRATPRRWRSRSTRERSRTSSWSTLFWNKHDPTQVNRQGWDVGDQYRSAIFTHSTSSEESRPSRRREQQERVHEADRDPDQARADVLRGGGVPPAVPREARAGLVRDPRAGDRDILDREGGVMAERMKPWKERDFPASEEEWRKRLTPEQFEVLRKHGDRARLHRQVRVDQGQRASIAAPACGAKLFDADTKFESGTGWPSFYGADPARRGRVPRGRRVTDAADRGALRALRRASGPRVRRRPAAHRRALLHELLLVGARHRGAVTHPSFVFCKKRTSSLDRIAG